MLSIEKTLLRSDKLSINLMKNWNGFRNCTSEECGFCKSNKVELLEISGKNKIEKKYRCSLCNREWVL